MAAPEGGVVKPAAPLPGCHSIFLTGTTLKILSIPDPPDAKALVPVSRKAVLDDVQFRGAISDFQPLKAHLQKSELEFVVLRYNEDDRYGDGNNYEVCCTQESHDAWLKKLEEVAAVAEEAAGPDGAPKREPPPPRLEIQPPRPWVSLGSEADLEEESVRPSASLAALKLVRKRKHFGAALQLSATDAQELFSSAQCECRPFRDPHFDLRRHEVDVGVQAAPPTRHAAAQAKGGLARSSAAQTQPRENEAPPDALRGDAVRAFLGRAVPFYESALQQNEVFDVFEDDFSGLGDDDAGGGGGGGKGDHHSISESQSFTDLAFSKGRTVSCIGWLPGRKNMVAVSCTDLLSFEDRLQLDGVARTSAVLVWSFADAIHPQYVLEAPSDVCSFQFNPLHPSVVVGGLYNGQVVQWDVSGVQDQDRRKDKRREEEALDKSSLAVKPAYTSSPADSHACAVTDLVWLPAEQEVTSKGKMGPGKPGECNFFITCAADGRLLFWDRHMKLDRTAKDKSRPSELPWAPTFEVSLMRAELGGFLACCRLTYAAAQKIVLRCLVASLDGEVGTVDFERPDDAEQFEYCKQLSASHSSPVAAVQASPHFEDVALSVGDWTFHVWREGDATPIFSSTPAACPLSAGCWSPTRPGVLFVARTDGVLEAWDFLDRSHEPSVTAAIASCAITQLCVHSQGHQTQVAAGDSQGALHIIDLPRSLRRPQPKEKQQIVAFFDRETARRSPAAGRGDAAAAAPAAAAVAAPATAAADAPDPIKEKEAKPAKALTEAELEDIFRKQEAAVKEQLGIQ